MVKPIRRYSYLFFSLLFLGVGFIALVWAITQQSANETVGLIIPDRGDVYLQSLNKSNKRILSQTSWKLGQVLVTGEMGRAKIENLESNLNLMVYEDSEVSVLPQARGFILRVIKGEVKLLSSDAPLEFKVQDAKGRLISAKEYFLDKKEIVSQKEESFSGDGFKSLSQDQVMQALQRVRPQLLKCYSQFLKISNERKKYYITARIIYSSKAVQQLDLSSYPELEQTLDLCLKDILRALNFGNMKVAPIHLELPIELE